MIFVDLRMPIMDGWSFIEQYRRSGGHARIIAGADDLLLKPFGIDAVTESVAPVLAPPSRPASTTAR